MTRTRARYAAYALTRRAAEAATVRLAVTAALGGHGNGRPVVLAVDLNDTVQAATTHLLQGPPGSEIGTRGFTPPDHRDPGAAAAPRPADAVRPGLLPDQPGTAGTHRPHPGLPGAGDAAGRGDRAGSHRRTSALD